MPEDAALIQQANYEENMELLRECDLVIEAIAERMDWKTDLYHKIAPFIAEGAIVASNTSGLSITKLSEALPESIKPRFCGIHFFNPPRYMTLVELINTPTTEPKVLDDLEAFVTSALGKGVIRAHDTPNFIANRVGIASMLATIKEAEAFKLSYDVVDDLTGKKLGRASSGTFRTADVVGLDTMAHVIKTLQDNLGPGKVEDPFSDIYGTPPVLAKLLESKSLGQKTGAGFYKSQGRDILRLDPESMDYVPAGAKADEVVGRMLKKPAGERLEAACAKPRAPKRASSGPSCATSFHYAAVHLESIAETARDIDFAMRWGFGSKQGPSSSGSRPAGSRSRPGSRKTLMPARRCPQAPLPEWVFKGPVAEAGGVHTEQGLAERLRQKFIPRRKQAGIRAPVLPGRRAGLESARASKRPAPPCIEDDAIRLWTLGGANDDVPIASIKTKMHAISPDVAEGLAMGVDRAEKKLQGHGHLVQRRDVFGRRRPAGHAARLHDGRRQGD